MKPQWRDKKRGISLYHADAREVLPSIAGASVGLVITDPPYGHNNNDGDLIHCRENALGLTKEKMVARPIANDGPEADDLVKWAFKEFNRLLLPGGGCCCCCSGGGGERPSFARWSLWLDKIIGFKQMVIWDKGKPGIGWHYRRCYETILVAQKKGAKARWFNDTKKVWNVIRPGDYGIRKIIPAADDHPTPKPVELAAHFIRLHSQKGDVVLDPFMGHGWVGQAAFKNGRKFVGVELDAKFFERAVANVEALINGGWLMEV